MLKDFFEREKIFFYRELSLSDLTVLDPGKLSRLQSRLGSVESAVIFLIPYFTGQKTTNLSIYAQPKDYHLYLKEITFRLNEYLAEKQSDLGVCGLTDSSPIAEREAALLAGLGVLGQNGLVLNDLYGSYFFIGEFFLSRALSPVSPQEIQSCPNCGACEKACPTGAIRDPKRERCLSLLTQKKNRTPEEDLLVKKAACKWGCDLCQSICPMNRAAQHTPIPFFREELISHLTEDVAELPKEDFSKRAFSWRGRDLLKRNLEE